MRNHKGKMLPSARECAIISQDYFRDMSLFSQEVHCMCGNYDQMSEDARKLFLTSDQEAILAKFRLKHTADAMFIRFLNREYRIDRSSGRIQAADTGAPAGNDETMSIYDMLCYSASSPSLPVLTGEWESLSSLGGIIGTSHTQKRLYTEKMLAAFTGHTAEMRAACEQLGGHASRGADVSYILPVFDFFPVWMEFWDGDDEFPPNIQFLWDKNSLQFLHYETLWYCTQFLEKELTRIIQAM